MDNRGDFLRVWLHVPNWWIEMADVNSEEPFEEIEYRASDMPIIALHSQQGLEQFQASGKSIPDATIILAKMKIEDMVQYVNYFYSDRETRANVNWEPVIAFDIEHGKFKVPSNDANTPTSRPKMK
ncbi:hypothetical protein [Burkholderia vietnamiensis]|uniref:hypothetical protein n=1 Tax=Burkholderia vietnamiensis TaxID=60552 RepID=UPI00158F08BA|nr:hypothetical protein [Burkholderia vietnamiensis]